MKVVIPRSAVLTFWIPLLALPLGLGLASVAALRPPVAPPLPETPEQSAPPPPQRLYMPLVTPITFSLSGGRGRIKITLGLALDRSGGTALLARLAPHTDALRADLAQTVLDLAEALPSDQPPEDFRTHLPDLLRPAMNEKLAELGEDPAVLEVLITEWAIAR